MTTTGQWRKPQTSLVSHYDRARELLSAASDTISLGVDMLASASDGEARQAAMDALSIGSETAALSAGLAQVEATLAVVDVLRELTNKLH